MKTNFGLHIFSFCLFVITSFLPAAMSAQSNFDFEDDQQVFVMLQLPSQKVAEYDSLGVKKFERTWVDAINRFNGDMGYAKMEKKVATFELMQGDEFTVYITIRKFENFDAAAQYAANLDGRIEDLVLGDIKEPFPISTANYKLCMEAKDFNAYYKLYKISGK